MYLIIVLAKLIVLHYTGLSDSAILAFLSIYLPVFLIFFFSASFFSVSHFENQFVR